MPKEFSFCFESQWAELLAMRFCPFLLLCSRVGLKRREEYAFSELAYSAGPGGAAICCLLFLIRIGLEYGAGSQALIKAGGRGFPPDSFSESNLMKKQRRS